MTEAVLLLLAGIVVILLIIAANGYFVAQEFAYMSVDRNRLASRARGGDAAAERALKVTRRTSFMLSGAQLGITVTGLMVGYVAEPMVGSALGVLLGGAGVPESVSILVGTVGVLAVATVVQMLFGELYPKNLAIANAEPMARWMARSTLIYLAVFGWLIAFFDRSANLLLRLVRIEPIHDLDTSATAEDLERIVADSRDSGDLPLEMSMLLDRILDFPDQDVEHAMVPRGRVDTVTPGMTVAELRTLMAHAHTRYPVVDGSLDRVVGVFHIKDFIRAQQRGGALTLRELVRPIPTIAATASAEDVLERFRRDRTHAAMVVDEHGGTLGLVTMDDVIADVMDDEAHSADFAAVRHDDGSLSLDGEVTLAELEDDHGIVITNPDVTTIAGIVLAATSILPTVGTTVTEQGHDLTVEEMLGRKITRVRIRSTTTTTEAPVDRNDHD